MAAPTRQQIGQDITRILDGYSYRYGAQAVRGSRGVRVLSAGESYPSGNVPAGQTAVILHLNTGELEDLTTDRLTSHYVEGAGDDATP